jgi:hypothetical protein
VAVNLTSDQDIAYFSWAITKSEATPDGDLRVFGKCTDGSLDRDLQVVDPQWSKSALQSWLDTGGNVRLQHDSSKPVGKGLNLEFSADGHYLTSLVVDDAAKELVRKGVLTAYSIGVSHPMIDPDPSGKAVHGIIRGHPDGRTEIAEVSLVDRPANRGCGFTLVKRAKDGTPEWVGEVFGADDELTAKSVSVDLPPDVSVSFSPADLAKLLSHRREAEERQKAAAVADAPKGEMTAAERNALPASAFAYVDSGGEGHLPVHDEGHVRSALGRFGQQQFDNSKSKRRAARKIVSRAKQLGIDVDAASDVAQAAGKVATAGTEKAADGMEPCGLCKGKGKIRGGNLVCPRCHGDGKIAAGETDEHGDSQDKDAEADVAKGGARDCTSCGKGHDADSPSKFCANCGTKLPAASEKEDDPDLVKASGDDDAQADSQAPDSGGTGEDGPNDSDDDDGDDDDPAPASKAAAPAPAMAKPKVPCPSCGKQVKAKMPFCPKCGGAMKAKADKAGKPTPGDGVTGEHVEPVPAHREPDGSAIEALEHDAGLPTDPDGKYEKAAGARIDALGAPYPLGALHDHLCPAYAPGMAAKAHPQWSPSDIDLAYWMEKALTAATQPGDWMEDAANAQALWQHAATVKGAPPETLAELGGDLHKAFADANPGPGTFPTPAELTPQRFRRPYITAGHAAPSPQADGPNTAAIPESGGITATDYTRGYLDAGHADDSPQNKADGGAPPKPGASNSGRVFYRNTARDGTRAAMQALHDHIAQTFPDLCAMKDDPNHDHAPAPSPLPRPAGSMKADEPAAGAETPVAKAAKPAKPKKAPADEGLMTREEAITWLASQPELLAKAAGATGGLSAPDLVKAAVADVVSPLLAELAATRAQLDTQAETLEAQSKALRKSHKILDSIAAQPDQNGPYRGAPLQQYPAEKAMAPAAVSSAQAAEQAQRMVYEELHSTWRNSPDATARLAAEEAMAKMRGIPSGAMITA